MVMGLRTNNEEMKGCLHSFVDYSYVSTSYIDNTIEAYLVFKSQVYLTLFLHSNKRITLTRK